MMIRAGYFRLLIGLAFAAMNGSCSAAELPEALNASAPVVTIDAFQFQPEHLTIEKGMSVIFINKDTVPHTVSPKSGAGFSGTGLITGGTQREVKFEKAGEQGYACDFHPSMMGMISVR